MILSKRALIPHFFVPSAVFANAGKYRDESERWDNYGFNGNNSSDADIVLPLLIVAVICAVLFFGSLGLSGLCEKYNRSFSKFIGVSFVMSYVCLFVFAQILEWHGADLWLAPVVGAGLGWLLAEQKKETDQ